MGRIPKNIWAFPKSFRGRRCRARGSTFVRSPHLRERCGALPFQTPRFPCGYHPWQAAPDGSFYSYRCELLPGQAVREHCVFFAWMKTRGACARGSTTGQSCPEIACSTISARWNTRLRGGRCPFCRRARSAGMRWTMLPYTYAQPRPWTTCLAPDALQKVSSTTRRSQTATAWATACLTPMPRLAGLRPFGAQAGMLWATASPFLGLRMPRSRCGTYRTARRAGHGGRLAEPVVFDTAFGPLSFPLSGAPAFVCSRAGRGAGACATLTARGTGGAGVELDFAVSPRPGGCRRCVHTGAGCQARIGTGKDGQYRLRYAGVDEAFCVRVWRKAAGAPAGDRLSGGCAHLPPVQPDHTFDDVLNPFRFVPAQAQ